jgi:hypothetical protein
MNKASDCFKQDDFLESAYTKVTANLIVHIVDM